MARIKETKVYSIMDFMNWYNQGELDLKPRYQRNPVWNIKTKSYLIDTLLRGLPIPQIFIRQIIDVKTMKSVREVIDGQQRLRAIIEFVQDEFAVMKSHNPEYPNMKYSDLDDLTREELLFYQIPVEVISTKDDNVIYDLFARLNTNSMTLNKQELRNASYRGEFKVFVYRITSKWRELFIKISMFTDKEFSRMNDAEFISSLIMLTMDGIIQETQKVIDEYYKKYDESIKNLDEIEKKINKIFEIIAKIFDNEKYETSYFHRKSYFYTLFSMLTHQMYGIDNFECKRYVELSEHNINNKIEILVNRMNEFEGYYEIFMDKNWGVLDDKQIEMMISFEQHHRTHTTSLKERKERVKIISDFIGSGLNEQ